MSQIVPLLSFILQKFKRKHFLFKVRYKKLIYLSIPDRLFWRFYDGWFVSSYIGKKLLLFLLDFNLFINRNFSKIWKWGYSTTLNKSLSASHYPRVWRRRIKNLRRLSSILLLYFLGLLLLRYIWKLWIFRCFPQLSSLLSSTLLRLPLFSWSSSTFFLL